MPSITFDKDNLSDWQRARPGQWFMGAFDVRDLIVMLLPAEIHWKDSIRDNTDQRGINRYASGDRSGQSIAWNSVSSKKGADGNMIQGDLAWQSEGPAHITLHTKICLKYNREPKNCVGFSLIKLSAKGDIAQFKGSSKSLNVPYGAPDTKISFAQKTVWAAAEEKKARGRKAMDDMSRVQPLTAQEQKFRDINLAPSDRPEIFAGTPQMPDGYREALLKFLKEPPWGIKSVAVSRE